MAYDLQIEPREVKERLDRGEMLVLLDVREPWEHAICRIEGSILVPMSELASRLDFLEKAQNVVVYCHMGVRSLNAAAWLRDQGVAGARSLAGGIARWTDEIDSFLGRY